MVLELEYTIQNVPLELGNSIQSMQEMESCFFHRPSSPQRYQVGLTEVWKLLPKGLLCVQTMSKWKLQLWKPHLVWITFSIRLIAQSRNAVSICFDLEFYVHILATGHCLTVSKKPYLGDSSRSIRSSLPSQSSLLSSPTATAESAVSSSPPSRFCCSATDIKSRLSSVRGIGTEQANLVSSVCTSPSSIDGCSLESSSTSTNQGSNKSTAWSETTMETHQLDESYVGYECREQSSPFSVSKKILADSSPVPSDADVSRNRKPSCLKRPSPKIGFFDPVSV